MTPEVAEVVLVLVIAAVVGTVGVVLGIFFLAPRVSRHLDRSDEEPGAGND